MIGRERRYDEMVGQIIRSVNGVRVKNMEHLAQLVEQQKATAPAAAGAAGSEAGDTVAASTELTIDFVVPKGAHQRSYLVLDTAEAGEPHTPDI